jgi:hypothetical protein
MTTERFRRFPLAMMIAAGCVVGWVGNSAWAADDQQAAPAVVPAEKPAESMPAIENAPPEKPFSLGVRYYLLSDYLFRGINFSEYAGEGREKPNHQMTTSLDIPLGKGGEYGTFGFDTFFEWFAGQKHINGSGQNIQEVDYTLRYSYDVAAINTVATIGWTEFTFPNVTGVGDDDRTHEMFLKLAHNDASWWRWMGYQGDDGILNPTFFIAYDWHMARGTWMEFSLSHPFEIAKNLTFTPSVTFAIDAGYLGTLLKTDDHDFRYAYTQFGGDLTYDATELLHLPAWAGTVTVGGQLFYTVPTESARHTGLDNEFWGGMNVGWNW